MEMKAEGLQVAEMGGVVRTVSMGDFCTSVEFTDNMGERSTCRPPPDNSLEGASTPVLWGGTLRHRGAGELARWESAARWPGAWPPGAPDPEQSPPRCPGAAGADHGQEEVAV